MQTDNVAHRRYCIQTMGTRKIRPHVKKAKQARVELPIKTTSTHNSRCDCRRAVQHRVSAAAAVQSSGGTLLHEYPDFILPFIIQSLAHHPDFPTQEVRDNHHLVVLLEWCVMLECVGTAIQHIHKTKQMFLVSTTSFAWLNKYQSLVCMPIPCLFVN